MTDTPSTESPRVHQQHREIFGPKHPLEIGDAYKLKFGPLILAIRRLAYEWRVETEVVEERDDTIMALKRSTNEALETFGTIVRHTFGATYSTFTLDAALANRPIVARPEAPLHVLPQETVTIYTSSPVWVQVRLPTGAILSEVPSRTLSDTWFGTHLEGELCYALKSHARLEYEAMPYEPNRAITPVQIQNESADPLEIKRVKIPAPSLSIWQRPDNQLITETITMRALNASEIRVSVGDTPPDETGGEHISQPRVVLERGVFSRTLGALLR